MEFLEAHFKYSGKVLGGFINLPSNLVQSSLSDNTETTTVNAQCTSDERGHLEINS